MAETESELSLAPPGAGEVTWLAARLGDTPWCEVRAQTWIVARAKAAAKMGLEPGQIEVRVK